MLIYFHCKTDFVENYIVIKNIKIRKIYTLKLCVEIYFFTERPMQL